VETASASTLGVLIYALILWTRLIGSSLATFAPSRPVRRRTGSCSASLAALVRFSTGRSPTGRRAQRDDRLVRLHARDVGQPPISSATLLHAAFGVAFGAVWVLDCLAADSSAEDRRAGALVRRPRSPGRLHDRPSAGVLADADMGTVFLPSPSPRHRDGRAFLAAPVATRPPPIMSARAVQSRETSRVLATAITVLIDRLQGGVNRRSAAGGTAVCRR
jgi:hypothetical protein